ncbi:MAG: DUF368 domain-containing protein [Beutenbergiaceae bacterium]
MSIIAAAGQVARGALMGAADIVPGVSGGTVALVLGIYERLIANIHAGSQAIKELLRGRIPAMVAALKRVEWVWLVSLLAGILTAVLALSGLIESLLTSQSVAMSGLFFGLVGASVLVAWRMLRAPGATNALIALLVGIAFFALLGLREGTHGVAGGAGLPWWVYLGSGAIAICAMILPGISGSFILVLLGTYGPVLGAVSDRNIGAIAIFALGCVIGLALFSTFLNWALRTYHDRVLAVMVGLLLGSLRVLWPWPQGVDSTALGPPSEPVLVPILLAALGATAVLVVERLASRKADPLAD